MKAQLNYSTCKHTEFTENLLNISSINGKLGMKHNQWYHIRITYHLQWKTFTFYAAYFATTKVFHKLQAGNHENFLGMK